MQLTQFTDFSFRVLIYLARLPEPGTATIHEMAEYYKISRNHLANEGFLQTTRGKGGGLRLARPAHTIGVGEIVRISEPNMNLVECFDLKANECSITRGCGLKGLFYEARRALMVVLDNYTLADAAASSQGARQSPSPPLAESTS